MFPPLLDQITREYLHAKDHNRPHALGRAFAEDASFTSRFEFETDFSDESPREGLAAITDTFRALGAACENIYTLCTLGSRGRAEAGWTCRWIVTMTERETGAVRVAWGDYLWRIDDERGRAIELLVTMVEMHMLAAGDGPAICEWMAEFEGPWVEGQELVAAMPRFDALAGVARYLGGEAGCESGLGSGR